jgi:peptidoglycan/LPS O-acetylase OafA/YrhL
LLLATYIALTATHFTPAGSHSFGLAPKSLSVSLFASVLYSHGWLFGTYPHLFPAGWSLEVEAEFYILAPFLFFSYFLSKRISLRTGIGVIAIAAAIWAGKLIPNENRHPVGGTPHLYFTLAPFFAYFLLGILLADLRTSIRALRLTTWIASTLGFCGGVALLCCGFIARETLLPDFTIAWIKVLAITSMFMAALTEESAFRRLLSRPWISFAGGACYSIYLTHLPVLQFAAVTCFAHARFSNFLAALALVFVLGIPAVLLVALLFYAVVERTFMNPHWPQMGWTWLLTLRNKFVRTAGAPPFPGVVRDAP